jgi:hypothetical protein
MERLPANLTIDLWMVGFSGTVYDIGCNWEIGHFYDYLFRSGQVKNIFLPIYAFAVNATDDT